ncbi:Kinesin-like protein KIF15 [Mizuhopecten yessoensis]|uniref:Kinesin-like protein KIF15 n=1 Tax=Mizuhopecten yessoensis TaxID=6573 RepID=A0A210QJ89_MIZYE|nr:Kinesin-like protein KIF15 [Mizuhopecten yessoensis]
MTAGGSNGAEEIASDGDAIKVFVRIRPPDQGDSGHQQSVDVDQTGCAVVVQTKPVPKIFTFDQVVNINAQQEAVFSVVGKTLIESCVSGYNGTIFAYGQTGSGKTFTMLGPSEDADNFQHKNRGIIPRSFEYLFNLVSREQELHGKGKEFLMRCTFLEIYHEQVYDLLDPSTMSLSLRESMKKGVYVDGLAEKAVTSASEAYQVLNDGWRNRRVASTSMNRESSRSHAVFTIFIESKEQKSGVQNVKESLLNLVDLAGSERQKDSNADGLRLKEAGSINKSLSVLGKCIMSLVDIAHDKVRHIPYRESKLTFLLRDSLGGNAKTRIIACVHPDSRHFGETLSTLQFARRAKMIKNKAKVNEDTQGNLMSLQAEIRRLKEENQQLLSAGGAALTSTDQSQGPKNHEAGSSVWKERFVNAMMLKEKSDVDKRPLQEKIMKLEELCNKKDKILQSTKMIIKFRENHITRLEKTIKSKEGWADSEELMVDLKAEIRSLEDKMEHNPMVTKYAMEIQHLKSELQQYRSSDATQEGAMTSSQRIMELERLFFDLMAKQSSDESEQEYVGTPTRTPVAVDNISVATIEKNKSLETQVVTLKQTVTEQKEAAEKREMELESEVASQKKTITELTTVLEAQQLKSKLERDVHFQTVQTITTPKKIRYNLRSTTHLNSSTSTTPNLDNSIDFEDLGDDLFAEAQPPFMMQQANEALRAEVEQLQSSNNNMTERIDEYESDAIKLKQHISKIDHQNAQLTEILQRERTERTTTGEKSDTELVELRRRLIEAERNLTYFKEEADDLRVVLVSSDKELKDIKAKKTDEEDQLQKTIGMLQTRLMQVDMETTKMSKEYESACEERDILMQDLENAQDTVRFNESLVRDLETEVQEGKERLEDVQSQLETVSKSLAIEKHNHDQLVCRTQLEGAAQEKENLQLVQENELLQSEAEVARVKLEQQEKTIQNLKGSTEAAQHIISTLQKQQEQNKEAVAGYMSRIEELRTALNVETNQLLDHKQQCQSLTRKLEEQAADLNTTEQVNKELQAKLEAQVDYHNAEMSMMKEDLDCITEANDKIQEEYASTQRELESTQGRCESLEEALKTKTSQLEDKETLHGKKIAEMEDQIKEIRMSNQEESKEQEWLTEELDTYPLLCLAKIPGYSL